MGLQVICVVRFTPANFQHATPFRSRHKVRYRTDDGHQCQCPLGSGR